MTDLGHGAAGGDAGAGELTDERFWEGYWGEFSLPAMVDERHSFDRALASAFRELLRGVSGTALEVGCAPGRWLAFLARECHVDVAGIEYTAAGAAATSRNLELLGVRHSEIRHADFFALTPEPRFDVVISLGFVEHFTDVKPVIARHVAWLRPGGRLIIGVPNFTGIHGWLQRLLDPGVLALHNVSIMRAERLATLGREAAVMPESVRYLGSIEPSLPITRSGVGNAKELVGKLVLRILRVLRRAPVIGRKFDRWNGPRISSYILACYSKPL